MTENKDTVISFRKEVLRGSRSAPDDLASKGRETSTSAAPEGRGLPVAGG